MDNQFQANQPLQPQQPYQPVNQAPPVTSAPKKSAKKPVLVTLLVIILLAGAAYGVYYWQHQKVSNEDTQVKTLQAQIINLNVQVGNLNKQIKALKVTTSTNSTTKNSYVGWDSYTLKNEKATFKYPSTWKLTDTSTTTSDDVSLAGPSNFQMTIETVSAAHTTPATTTQILGSTPVTFLTKNGYIDYLSTNNDAKVEQIYLSQSATNYLDSFASKSGGSTATTGGNFNINAQYTTKTGETLIAAKADANYNDAIGVIESMTY